MKFLTKGMVAAIAVPSPNSTTILKNSSVPLKELNSNFLGGLSHSKSHCFQLKPSRKSSSSSSSSRRDVVSLVVASSGTTTTDGGGRFYLNFTGFPFPLGPFLNRRTIRTEVSLTIHLDLSFTVLPLSRCTLYLCIFITLN